MDQLVKEFATQCGDLSSVLGTHVMEEKNWLSSGPLTSICAMTYMCTYTHTYTH